MKSTAAFLLIAVLTFWSLQVVEAVGCENRGGVFVLRATRPGGVCVAPAAPAPKPTKIREPLTV